MAAFKWLYPGTEIKRAGTAAVGTTILALGFAYLLRSIYDTGPFQAFIYNSLCNTTTGLRAVLFGLWAWGVVVAIVAAHRSLLSGFSTGRRQDCDIEYRHRFQTRRGAKESWVIAGGNRVATRCAV